MTKEEEGIMKVCVNLNYQNRIKSRPNLLFSTKQIIKLCISILGTLKNWWSNSTGEEYEKRAQCIIDQYGNFTAEQVGLNLNGINTQGENIADNGGIKESYGGYGKLSHFYNNHLVFLHHNQQYTLTLLIT